MKNLSFVILCSMLAILFFLPHQLFAHKVNIYAYISDGIVYSESYFADGSRCRSCAVEVFDKKTGKILLDGKTDENGKISFKMPPVGSLKLVLKAGAGHQAIYYLSLDEKLPTDKSNEATAARSKFHDKTGAFNQEKCLSPEELEAVVNKAVEAKLQQVMSRLGAIQENIDRSSVREIIGGIGYIIGIAGIVLYLTSRRNPANKR